MLDNKRPIWVIYENTGDAPGRFVARKWAVDKPTGDVINGATLEDVREKIPRGLMRFPRDHSEDDDVVETWF
jgi:hypothetical protein